MKKKFRKAKHIEYIYERINELHADIFHSALEIVNCERDLFIGDYMREELGVKIALYRKYNRRLRLLEL
tara:strand:+ start:992 stop:1198 length:207 start_codon:yes stop_codon:yes gene_type:complete